MSSVFTRAATSPNGVNNSVKIYGKQQRQYAAFFRHLPHSLDNSYESHRSSRNLVVVLESCFSAHCSPFAARKEDLVNEY
uniref:Uncharacterized protein n=1 Tax=Solanum tuberosum TaxID=4113 RepID=M1BS40_SOLTU